MKSTDSVQAEWWRDRPVLVTGCSGILGSWLTQELVKLDARVVGLVRDQVPGSYLSVSGALDRITIVRGDIFDQALLERVMNEYEVKTVFHLAAQTLVGTANRNPVSTFEANIGGTWALLEAARRTPGIEQVLVASSDKAYGAQASLPYTESTPLQGRHPYDVSKSCADLIAQSYAATYNLPVCITRCGNLYGGGDLNWSRIVPGTMRAIIHDEPPVIRSDGRLVRDYLYVEDGVRAYLMLAQALKERPSLAGQAFNFGNNAPISVLELVQKILAVAGRSDLQPQILDRAHNEIPRQYLDSSQAERELGWLPLFTLEEGLQRTLEWYRKHLER